MSKMKEKNLRRFVAIYIAGSIAFGGVAYAEEYLDGEATTINNAEYADDSVYGGSKNANVGSSSITISNGDVSDLIGGGQAVNSGTANVIGTSTIKINNGTVENVTGGGTAGIDGNIVSSGSVSVAESVITISGNSQIGLIQGGGDSQGDGSTATVTKSTITINGGTIGIGNDDHSFGGGFATAAVTQNQMNTSNVGNVTIDINNATFKNSLYGGGNSDIY